MGTNETPQTIDPDRFELGRELGSGGFGVVYEAFDRQRGVSVALKQLHRVSGQALYRFKQEFRELSNIAHTNLVTLYELFSDGKNWFFTMERVQGENFVRYLSGAQAALRIPADIGGTGSFGWDGPAGPMARTMEYVGAPPTDLARKTPANTDRLIPAFRQLVDGIGALHRAGKLHRDIKPSNILVTADGTVKLLDFGLVKSIAADSRLFTAHVAGTPGYMSPEQGAGRPLTESSDWYSVGVVLYEALTGELPFEEKNLFRLIARKQTEIPQPPSKMVLGVPAELDQICRGLLMPKPEQRLDRAGILQLLGAPAESASFVLPALRSHELVGRFSHTAQLNSAFERVQRDARPVVVCIHGESGMGKSALAAQAMKSLRDSSDALCFSGRCYERESLPFKGVDSLVDSLARYLSSQPQDLVAALLPGEIQVLARLFPVLHTIQAVTTAPEVQSAFPDQQELRHKAIAVLRELLQRLAREQPVVLFIDDLQWGDVDSTELLSSLFLAGDPLPILWLLAYRRDEVDSTDFLRAFLRELDRERADLRVEKLALDRLEQTAASQWIARELPGCSPAASRRIYDESDGNPFFIEQMLLNLQGAQAAETPEQLTLSAVLSQRFRQIPDEAYQLLEVLAVAAHPVSTELAIAAADLQQCEQDLASLLLAHQLVSTLRGAEAQRLMLRHDKIRETVAARLSEERSRALHLSLVSCLKQREEADAELLTEHLRAAGELAQAAEYAARAADEAAQALAFRRAARLYREALEGLPAEDSRIPDLRERLADMLSIVGRSEEAGKAYLELLPLVQAKKKRQLLRLSANQLLRAGAVSQARDVVALLLRSQGIKIPRTRLGAMFSFGWRWALLRCYSRTPQLRPEADVDRDLLERTDDLWVVSSMLSVTDPLFGGAFQTRFLLHALKTREPRRLALALANEALLQAIQARHEMLQIDQLLDHATAMAARVDDPRVDGWLALSRATRMVFSGRHQEALRFGNRAKRLYEEHCQGLVSELMMSRAVRFGAMLYLGRMAQLEREVKAEVARCREFGDVTGLYYFQAQMSLVFVATEDPDEARRQIEEGAEREGIPVAEVLSRLFGTTCLELLRGDGAAASRTFEESWPGLVRMGVRFGGFMYYEALYLRARVAIMAANQHVERAANLRLARSVLKRMRRFKGSWFKPYQHAIRAGLAAANNDLGETLAELAVVERLAADSELQLHRQSARRARAVLLGQPELVDEVDRWMLEQRVRDPERFCRTVIPV